MLAISRAPMDTDDRLFLLEREAKELNRRVERLEGLAEQFRRETIHPTLLFPSRREFDELKQRVARLDNSV